MNTKILLINVLLLIFIGFSSFGQNKTVYMVADAHLDTQWDWDVQTTINQYIKNTLTGNFALFKKFPDYKFNFEGAIKYMWFKKYYPELYEELKTYVANGQWNIAGSSLDASDVIIPSPESQFRNILIGQTFYQKEFGKKGNDIFLPDCFGFGITLPTIATHCGLIGFSTQKLTWGGITIPFRIGVWQGVDSSKILSAVNAGGYGDQFHADISNNSDLISWANETGAATNGKHYETYRYFGTGDRGGAPDSLTVSWLEKGLVSNGALKVKSAASGDFYKDNIAFMNDFPLYSGELIMTTHGTGCYTSKAMMKRWNRKNELLADAAEKSSVIADWMGGQTYPTTTLNDAWIKFLWHQFHDDLTGTACVSAYTFSQNDELMSQNAFSTVLKNSVGAGVRSLNTQTTGIPIVVYNPLSIKRSDVVEVNLKVSQKSDNIQIFDKSGVEMATQILSNSDTLVRFLFNATVNSLGYEVYDVQQSSSLTLTDSNLKISTTSLENSIYTIKINANGDISSIIDKSFNNKELLTQPIRLQLLTNDPSFWPSWEVMYTTITKLPVGYVDGTPTITIDENGPLRVTLKVTRKKGNSTFTQYIRLTNTDSKKRIDVENDINWQTQHTLLKAAFPLSVNNLNATYDLGIGVIKRPINSSNRYEVPSQQWADITNSDNSYGVSILNDCKYGWDKPNYNTLRLSLIHSPEASADNQNYKFQENQDMGNNKFTYSIYGHSNTCLNAASTWEAAKLNQPLIAFQAVKHDGSLGKSFSFVSVDTSQVAIMALKRAENTNDYVLRLYETKGVNAKNVKIKFAGSILYAKELNGIEEEIGDASYTDSTLTVDMKAFRPKTYSVRLSAPLTSLALPVSKPLPLTYNSDIITKSTNMADGNFDGQYNSYAAELLPDTIICDGIKFGTGPKVAGGNNAIRCAGNTIPIPAGYKKLYILASSSNPNGTTAKFNIDKTGYSLHIPFFSKFVGQATTYSFIGGDTVIAPNYVNKTNIAWSGDYLHNGQSKTNVAYVFTYLFKFCIPIPEGATNLILPYNNNIAVFSVTVANNENDDTNPSIELMDLQKPEIAHAPKALSAYCGVNLSKGKVATASGFTSNGESPSMAFDDNESTKWCQNVAGDKWVAIDLGARVAICEWKVKHAGMESENYITKDFKLQKLNGTVWVDVDAVKGNLLNTTDRLVDPFVARKVRLYVTNSGSDNAVRIDEFQLFGSSDTTTVGINEIISADKPTMKVYPNPVRDKNFNIELNGFENNQEISIIVTDVLGKMIFTSNMKNSILINLTINNLNKGIYFISVANSKTILKSEFVVE